MKDQKVKIKILVTVTSQTVEFFINLYQLMNHLQKLSDASKLVHQLITIYVENQSHHQNHQPHLMKSLKSLVYYFLFMVLIYKVVHQPIFTFKMLYQLFYIEAKPSYNTSTVPPEKCLLFYSTYFYILITISEINIVQQTTGCDIISLTSCKLSCF